MVWAHLFWRALPIDVMEPNPSRSRFRQAPRDNCFKAGPSRNCESKNTLNAPGQKGARCARQVDKNSSTTKAIEFEAHLVGSMKHQQITLLADIDLQLANGRNMLQLVPSHMQVALSGALLILL